MLPTRDPIWVGTRNAVPKSEHLGGEGSRWCNLYRVWVAGLACGGQTSPVMANSRAGSDLMIGERLRPEDLGFGKPSAGSREGARRVGANAGAGSDLMIGERLRPEDLGFGKLFERIRDAVIVADAHTQRIILWNPRAPARRGAPAARGP